MNKWALSTISLWIGILLTVSACDPTKGTIQTPVTYTHEGITYSNCILFTNQKDTSDQTICFKEIDTWYGNDQVPDFFIQDGVYTDLY